MIKLFITLLLALFIAELKAQNVLPLDRLQTARVIVNNPQPGSIVNVSGLSGLQYQSLNDKIDRMLDEIAKKHSQELSKIDEIQKRIVNEVAKKNFQSYTKANISLLDSIEILLNNRNDSMLTVAQKGLKTIVLSESQISVIDEEGEFLVNADKLEADPRFVFQNDFTDGLAPIKIGQVYGYVNPKGEVKIEPQFDYAGSFGSGFAPVFNNGEYYFIDGKGMRAKKFGKFNFKMLTSFVDGYCLAQVASSEDLDLSWKGVVSRSYDWVILDVKNSVVEELSTAYGSKFFSRDKDGFSLFYYESGTISNWFLYNKKGMLLLEKNKIKSLSEGKCCYREGKTLWGYYDALAESVIVSPRYQVAGDFLSGLAIVSNDKGKYGVITPKKVQIIPFAFASIKRLPNNRFECETGELIPRKVVIGRKGEYLDGSRKVYDDVMAEVKN